MPRRYSGAAEVAHYLPGRVRLVVRASVGVCGLRSIAQGVASLGPVHRVEVNPWARSLTAFYSWEPAAELVPVIQEEVEAGLNEVMRLGPDPRWWPLQEELAEIRVAPRARVGSQMQTPGSTLAPVTPTVWKSPAGEPEDRPLKLQIAQAALTGTLLAVIGAQNRSYRRRGVTRTPSSRWFNLSALVTIISGYPQLKSGLGQLARGRINHDLLLGTANLALIAINRSTLALWSVWLQALLSLAETLAIMGSKPAQIQEIEEQGARLFPKEAPQLTSQAQAEEWAEEIMPVTPAVASAQQYAQKATAWSGGAALLAYAWSGRPDRALATLLSGVPAASTLAVPAAYSLGTVRAYRLGLRMRRPGILQEALLIDGLLISPEALLLDPQAPESSSFIRSALAALRQLGPARLGVAVAELNQDVKARVLVWAGELGLEAAEGPSRQQVVQAWQDQGLRVAYLAVAAGDLAALNQAHLGLSLGAAPVPVQAQAGVILAQGWPALTRLWAGACRAEEVGRQGLHLSKWFHWTGMALSWVGVFSPGWATYWNHLVMLAVIANAGRVSRNPFRQNLPRPRVHEPVLTVPAAASAEDSALVAGLTTASAFRGAPAQVLAPTSAPYQDSPTGAFPAFPAALPGGYWPEVIDPEHLALALGTNLEYGLSMQEARRRLGFYGPNLLPQRQPPSFWARLGEQLRGFGTGLLMASSLLSLALGQPVDAVAILSIVGINGIMGAWQSQKADRALEALHRLTPTRVLVIRGGRLRSLPAAQLVPGDVMMLREGDVIAADARLVASDGLATDEALLTGESFPVSKQAHVGARGLKEAPSVMVYSGTHVVRGQGQALVVASGAATEMGRLALLMTEPGPRRRTLLERRLDRLNRTLVKGSLLAALVVGAGTWARGTPAHRALMNGVGLAVAAIPEGASVMVTLALGLGALRMARSRVAVQKLSAVETLGQATVICTDKTGTLTANRLTVAQVLTSDGGEAEAARQIRALALLAGSLASQANAVGKNGKNGSAAGAAKLAAPSDPVDRALHQAAVDAGLGISEWEEQCTYLGCIPFSSERARMSTCYRMPGGEVALFVKGSPEVILSRCRYIYGPSGVETITKGYQQQLAEANQQMASRALRVLAVACRVFDGEVDELASAADPGQWLLSRAEELEADLILLGLVGMWDPPRLEVPPALQLCRRAGIKVVVLTGDQAASAAAVARNLGLLAPGQVPYTGSEVAGWNDAQLEAGLADILNRPVIARVTPEDKLRLVRALRRRGEIVAMIGDGINDAPAIREADIGVAMGSVGTEVARRAADLVLLDDNFANLVKAVAEGRGIYSNIRRAMRYLLATNTAEVMLILACAVSGQSLPLLPVQMLWLNLLGDGMPALALVLDPPEAGSMNRPPRRPDEDLFSDGMGSKILTRGASIGLTSGLAYLGALRSGNLARARTLTLTALTVSQLLHVLDCRENNGREPQAKSAVPRGRERGWAVPATLAASGLLTVLAVYWPWLAGLLGTVPLAERDWLAIGMAALLSKEIDLVGRQVLGRTELS